MNLSAHSVSLWLAAIAFLGTSAHAQIDAGRITLVKDKHPSWSPDGQFITFYSTRDGDGEIFTVRADGSGLRQLTFNTAEDRTPVWSVDGKTIVFQSDRDGNNEIYSIDVASGEEERLTRHPASDEHPKFSADGKYIIFNSARDDDAAELYRMHLATRAIERLTHWPLYDTYGEASADGGQLVWRRVLDENGDAPKGRNSEIFVANADGGQPRNLTRNPAFDGWPAWSPDGGWILFSSNRNNADPADFNIWAMRPDGSALQGITHSPGYEDARADVSHDGRVTFNRQIGGSGAMEVFVRPWIVAPEPVTTRADDGVTVHGYKYFAQLGREAPLVTLFHQGRANARGEYHQLARWLNVEGFRVIAWDQRAGGELYGSINQTVRDLPVDAVRGYCDVYADMDAALGYLARNDLADKTVVWGSSYSGALVFKLAASHPERIAGIIAFSPSTGASLNNCRARDWLDALSAPAMVLRPQAEMERESSQAQRALFTAAGVAFRVIEDGVHGSSALSDERTGKDMAAARKYTSQWLREL